MTAPRCRTAARFYDDAGVQLPVTGLYLMRGADHDRLHYAPFAAATTLEIDCSTIPINRPFKIATRNVSGARAVLDAGEDHQWIDGGQFLEVLAGTCLEIQRIDTATFMVMSSREPAGAITVSSSFAKAERDKSILLAGQSLITQGFSYGTAAGQFLTRYRELISVVQSINFVNAASGGSAICERDNRATWDNYWVDMTDPDNPADGPLLLAARDAILTKGGDETQPSISAVIWDQGQTSALEIDTAARQTV